MSNKGDGKLDGVFNSSPEQRAADQRAPDIRSTGPKPAADGPKPARPPKPKVALGRETKVGLAVIGALLVIFVVVLVVRLRGEPDDDVAQKQSSATKGDQAAKSDKTQRAGASNGPTVMQAAPGLQAKSGVSGNGQYLFETPAGKADVQNGGAGSKSIYGESAYPQPGNAADQVDSRGGYLPQRTGVGSTTAAIGRAGLQGQADGRTQVFPDDETTATNPLRSGQGALPMDSSRNMAGGAAFPRDGADSIAPPFALDTAAMRVDDRVAQHDEVAPASDEANPDDLTASPATAGASDPFRVQGAGGPALNTELNSRIDSPASTASASQRRSDAFDRAAASDANLSEAEKYNPGETRSTTSLTANADHPADDKSGLQVVVDDNRDRDDLDVNAGAGASAPGKFTAVKGYQSPSTAQQRSAANTAIADDPHDTEAPAFSATRQSAAEPARLDASITGAPKPSPIRRAAPAGAGETYTVQSNETYWTIARKTYGSGAYFKALYEHNRRRADDADALRPGAQLEIPDEATLQRLYPALCPRPRKLAAASGATRASANVEVGRRAYVVNDGDTLYEIARRQLGRASRWAEVYELNRDAIGSATERLEPGTRLVLPEERTMNAER